MRAREARSARGLSVRRGIHRLCRLKRELARDCERARSPLLRCSAPGPGEYIARISGQLALSQAPVCNEQPRARAFFESTSAKLRGSARWYASTTRDVLASCSSAVLVQPRELLARVRDSRARLARHSPVWHLIGALQLPIALFGTSNGRRGTLSRWALVLRRLSLH